MRGPFWILWIAALLVVSGCGVRVPTSGVEPGARGRYARIVVIPLLADRIAVVSPGGLLQDIVPRISVDWDTREKAGRIAGELLEPVGTRVSLVGDLPEGGDAQAPGEAWPKAAWERLRAANRLGDAQAVLVLRQNAIDARGRQYAPAMDFMAFGLVGLTVGAATQEKYYHPSFSVILRSGFDASVEGRGQCSISFDAVLLEAASGRELSRADMILGREALPETMPARGWNNMDAEQRGTVRTYCIAALRRAISQAVAGTELAVR